MTAQQLKDKMIRSVARSMEAEGADYNRILRRMRSRIKSAEKKSGKA